MYSHTGKSNLSCRLLWISAILVLASFDSPATAQIKPVRTATSGSSIAISFDTPISNLVQQLTVRVNTNGESGGSGVIIAQKESLYTILTANHVVRELDRAYTIETYDGRIHTVEEIYRLQIDDKSPDLAIVKFRSTNLYRVAKLAGSSQVAVPAAILVSGFPMLRNPDSIPELSPGFITSFNPARPQGYAIHYSAPTWKGMSGGPIFDIAGRVVGIHGQGGNTNVGTVKTYGISSRKDEYEENLLKTGFNSGMPITTFLSNLPLGKVTIADLQVEQAQVETSESIVANPYIQGLTQFEAGDRQGAINSYNQAIRANPKNADAYFQRGVLQHEIGDLKGAIADYTRAIKIDRKYINAYYNRAIARATVGDAQGAISDYSQVISLDPAAASAYNNRGRLLGESGNFQSALSDFNQALQIESKRPNTYLNRGLLRYRARDFKGAIADFTIAIQQNPNYAKAYGNRGAAYAQIKNREAAINNFQQAANLFLEQEMMDDYEKALIQIEKAKREL